MINYFRKRHYRGDTMVEVMLSMAVIGMVIGSAYTISNRSTQLGRLAQQRTQVNNQMRAQAELLKLFRDNNSSQWSSASPNVKSLSLAATKSAPDSTVTCNSTRTLPSNAFYIDATQTIKKYDPSQPNNSGDPTSLSQIWIEPYRVTATYGTGYTDFYIIGCWQGPGSYGQQQSFIVERLNDPS